MSVSICTWKMLIGTRMMKHVSRYEEMEYDSRRKDINMLMGVIT
jgi:hypothetical protein